MVRVYGPAMSLDASGTLANTITYSKWKGRNYVRERVIPSNPKTGPQTGRRAMFKFLSQAWAGIPASPKASWDVLGESLVASPFNGYVSLNMKRWHNFLAPTYEDPWTPTLVVGTDGDDGAATWEENRIKIAMDLDVLNDNWNKILFASLSTGFTPSVGNCIMVELMQDLDPHIWYWTPPSVGTWFFRGRNGAEAGAVGALDTEFSAVP